MVFPGASARRRQQTVGWLAAVVLAVGMEAGAGYIWGVNRAGAVLDAPVLDADGVTPISGANLRMDFLAGPNPQSLGVNNWSWLGTGMGAGYVAKPVYVVVAGEAGSPWYYQVYVGEPEADLRGGRWVKSEVVRVTAGTFERPGIPVGLKPMILGPPRRGTVRFRNRVPGIVDAPVFAADGITRLAGGKYVAQLHARLAEFANEEMVASGEPAPFGEGASAGYWEPGQQEVLAITGVGYGRRAAGRIHVWEADRGGTFDEALQAGSVVGVSDPIDWVSGQDESSGVPTPVLAGLKSFRLSEPMPGTLDFRNHGTGVDDWRLRGGSPHDPFGNLLAAPFVVQLWVGRGEADLRPVTAPAPLGSGEQAGRWTPADGGLVTLTNFVRGERVLVSLRVWNGNMSPTYDGALGRDFRYRSSVPIWVRPGGDGFAPPAAIPAHRALLAEGTGVNRLLVQPDSSAVVFDASGRPLSDTNYVAQYFTYQGDQALAISLPARLGTGVHAGLWQPTSPDPIVLGYDVGCCESVQVRIWNASRAGSFEAAAGWPRAVSKVVTVRHSSPPPVRLTPALLGTLRLSKYGWPMVSPTPSALPTVRDIEDFDLPWDRPGFVGRLHVAMDGVGVAEAFARGEGGTPTGPVGTIGTGASAGVWELPVLREIALVGVDWPFPSSDVEPETRPVAWTQLRVWEKAKGATYAEALSAGGVVGYSEVVRVELERGMFETAKPITIEAFPIRGRRMIRMVPPGLSLVSNPAGRSATPTLDGVLPEATLGTRVDLFDDESQTYRSAVRGDRWMGDPLPILAPGHGFFVHNSSIGPQKLVFEGLEDSLPPLSRPTGRPAFHCRANTLGRPMSFEELTGLSPRNGDAAFAWSKGDWTVWTFDFGAWSPGVPVLEVGETWFVRLGPRSTQP